MIRDNALFVSGLLQEGDAFNFSKPYQPAGYYRHLNFPSVPTATTRMRINGEGLHALAKTVFASHDEGHGRSVQRGVLGQASPFQHPQRGSCLLNDPTLLKRPGLWRPVSSRRRPVVSRSEFNLLGSPFCPGKAKADEVVLLVALFKETEKNMPTIPSGPKNSSKWACHEADASLDPLELASWTMVSRAILNLG